VRLGAHVVRGPTDGNDVQGMLDFTFQAQMLMLCDPDRPEQETIDMLDGPLCYASGIPGADVHQRARSNSL